MVWDMLAHSVSAATSMGGGGSEVAGGKGPQLIKD